MKPINFNELEEITKDEYYELPENHGIVINNLYEDEISYFKRYEDYNVLKFVDKYLESLNGRENEKS